MLRRLALALAATLVALGIAEVVLRMVYTETDIAAYKQPEVPQEAARWVDHPFLPFAGRPNARYTMRGNDGAGVIEAEVRNNSYGFRTSEFPETKPEGAFHIVTLGGSTTWGALALTNDDTWPGHLETKLRARYPGREIRVFNLATQNATSAYSAVVLALIGTSLEPDLVVAYHGFNDVGPSLGLGYRVDHAHHFRDLAIEQRWLGVQSSLPRAMLSSYAITFVTAAADKLLGANRLSWYVDRRYLYDLRAPLDSERFEALYSRNARHLRTIDALARGYGGRALFSTFQFFEQKLPYRDVNPSLRAFFEEHGLDYVDLDALMADEDRALQFDECHFTARGREAVAAHFLDAIVERGWIEDPIPQ